MVTVDSRVPAEGVPTSGKSLHHQVALSLCDSLFQQGDMVFSETRVFSPVGMGTASIQHAYLFGISMAYCMLFVGHLPRSTSLLQFYWAAYEGKWMSITRQLVMEFAEELIPTVDHVCTVGPDGSLAVIGPHLQSYLGIMVRSWQDTR